MTFEQFRDHVLLVIRKVGRTFDEPDDDWVPVVFAYNPAVSKIETISPTEMLDTPRGKDFFADIALPVMLTGSGALYAAFLSSAWTVSLENLPVVEARALAEQLSRTGVSNHPDRREILMVQVATAERCENWHAQIVRRTDGPPQLGDWHRQEGQSEGRFANAVQRALQYERPRGWHPSGDSSKP